MLEAFESGALFCAASFHLFGSNYQAAINNDFRSVKEMIISA